jgi:hypothetical protein
MENYNVVNGLLRRRQEIADDLDVMQGRVRQLVIELDALNVTIRLFRPQMEMGVVRVKPIPRRQLMMVVCFWPMPVSIREYLRYCFGKWEFVRSYCRSLPRR